MEETIVSFQVAKLAKEKGFNIPTIQYYTPKGYCTESADYMTERYAESNWNDGQGSYPTKAEDVSCSAPTQSLLQKWIREVHNIHITIFSQSQESWMYRITKKSQKLEDGLYGEDFYTYEEALEEGLYQALLLV